MQTEFGYEEFLPLYPDVDDPQLQQKLFHKHEFQQLRLTRELEPSSGDPGVLAQHQRIVQRFLSPHTLYDELLVCHETGTGKSRVAFAISEALLQSGAFTRAFVLTVNTPIRDNLKQELALYSERLAVNEPGMRGILSPRASKWYQWHTFYDFAKQLTPVSDAQLHEQYAGAVFIVDEVHRLIKSDESGRDVGSSQRDLEQTYNQFHRLFHACRNRKIVLLSATPMRDKVYELAQIMNLILPADAQLPVRGAFEARFIDRAEARLRDTATLKEALRGRVSYVTSPQSAVERVFQGENASGFLPVEAFRVWTTEMHPFQAAAYTKAFPNDAQEEDDGARHSFYGRAREAALFVFPDGSVGKEGEERYLTARNAGSRTARRELLPALVHEVDTLDKLRRFSSKYAFILEDILQNPTRNTFVYCHYVNGSGLKLFAKLLEVYGFTEATGNPTETRHKARRYICLTGSSTPTTASTDAEQRRQRRHLTLKNFFNHDRNVHGEYCQVVLGSDIASVSFSFKNVQTIHVTTLHWNYTETHQVLGRGLRLGSHTALLQRQADVVVRVFQHASVVPQNAVPSVDLLMFRIAQEKDILIRRMFRLLKEAAFDCPLAYERNRLPDTADASRDCDYDACAFVCDSAAVDQVDEWDTFRLYFAEDAEQEIQRAVYRLFAERTSFATPLHLSTLVDLLGVDELLLLRVLARMIRINVPIRNTHGVDCFLRESVNRYYLVDNLALQGEAAEMAFYTRVPFVTHTQSLSRTLQQRRFEHDLNWLSTLSDAKTEEDVRQAWEHLSGERQQQCLEYALSRAPEHVRTQLLLQVLGDAVRINDRGYRFVSALSGTERGLTAQGRWEDVPRPEPDPAQVFVDANGVPQTLYGLLADGKFKVVDRRVAVDAVAGKVDKRKINTGLDCKSKQRQDLAALCVILGLPAVPVADPAAALQRLQPKLREKFQDAFRAEGLQDAESIAKGLYWMDTSISKTQLCDQLQQWFSDRGLLFGPTGEAQKVDLTQ